MCWFFLKSCSSKYRKIKRKTPIPDLFIKNDSGTGFSCEFSKIFNNNFFTEHLWVTPSGSYDYGFIIKEVMLADAEVFCL